MSARNVKLAAAALLALAAGGVPATQLFDLDREGLRKARYMEALMFGRGELGGPFTLTDQRGERRRLEDFRGRLVLLYFGYTFCPDVCAADLVTLKALLDEHGEQVQIIFITLDPERDTPEQLAAYLPHFHVRIVGLTGTTREIRDVADRYKAYYAKAPLMGSGTYLVDHSAAIYLLDQEGRFRGAFPPGASLELMTGVLKDFL